MFTVITKRVVFTLTHLPEARPKLIWIQKTENYERFCLNKISSKLGFRASRQKKKIKAKTERCVDQTFNQPIRSVDQTFLQPIRIPVLVCLWFLWLQHNNSKLPLSHRVLHLLPMLDVSSCGTTCWNIELFIILERWPSLIYYLRKKNPTL